MFANKEVFRQYLCSNYRNKMSFQQYLKMLSWWKN
jgi:hypothetical protein